MKHSKISVFYIAIVLLLMIIPFGAMFFFSSNEDDAGNAEKRDLTPWPAVKNEDGKINMKYLSGMGDYFQDHFAFRDQMIAANAVLKSVTVKSNPSDEVIIGKDDWLYYSGTMDDYLGRSLLTDRELYSAAHNLSLIRDYAEGKGSQFFLTISPNKNSVYGDNMPNNYIRSEKSNEQNLKPLLENAGINYIDVYDVFNASEEELYLKRDSHWNNKGAVLVYNKMMDALGKTHETYENIKWETRNDHIGDIDEMLYIDYYKQEAQFYPDVIFDHIYVNDVSNNMDSWIETSNEKKDDCLLMYRDSFGESILPFFAEEFERAYFSRLMPYNLANIDEYAPDYVVIQKVERTLIDFVARAPILTAPEVENVEAGMIESLSTIEAKDDGPYTVISGEVDLNILQTESDILLSVKSEKSDVVKTYKASYLSSENRTGNKYAIYLDKASLSPGNLVVQLIVQNGDKENTIVHTETILAN